MAKSQALVQTMTKSQASNLKQGPMIETNKAAYGALLIEVWSLFVLWGL
jgi:hypothetical protein